MRIGTSTSSEAKKLARKVKTGKGFDLDDFKAQIAQMRKMGGLAALVDKLPAELARAAQGATLDERRVARIEGHHQLDDAARSARSPNC